MLELVFKLIHEMLKNSIIKSFFWTFCWIMKSIFQVSLF